VGKWDDFTEDVDADSAISKQGPRCKTCNLLLTLPRDAAEKLDAALKSPIATSTSIRRALMNRIDSGIPSAYSIARHRRGDCREGLK
jgi:hypothetical protein